MFAQVVVFQFSNYEKYVPESSSCPRFGKSKILRLRGIARILAAFGRGTEFTQPCNRSFAEPCSFWRQWSSKMRENEERPERQAKERQGKSERVRSLVVWGFWMEHGGCGSDNSDKTLLSISLNFMQFFTCLFRCELCTTGR